MTSGCEHVTLTKWFNIRTSMEFYQPRFWGLNPVFSARVKLNICDVLTLQEYPGFAGVYCILNHPIVNVHIVGDVVSISKKSRLIEYELDDGSGVISCCQWRKVADSDEGMVIPKLGQLVSVFGRVSEYREERQIKVNAFTIEEDPNAEPLHWLEVIQLKRTVYSKPFSLPLGISTQSGVPQKPVKEAITETLLHYLQAMGKSFSLSELKRDGGLREACLHAVKESCSHSKWNEVEVNKELAATISALPNDGHVVPTGLTTHAADTVYEVLSDEKHLFPLILQYMKEKLKRPQTAKFGVPEDWIVQRVKQKKYLWQLSTARIVAAIKQLEDTSQIFPVAYRTYKCVT